MLLAILSDDLTGASGVASMINEEGTITVNYENLSNVDIEKFNFISINLDVRDSNIENTSKLMSEVLSLFQEQYLALRIDSTLRGNISTMVKSIIEKRKVLITDTIPEYGRFTENGFTVLSGIRKNIAEIFDFPYEREKITIADSKTYDDIDALAEICIRNNLVPIDPIPLIARYAKKLTRINKPKVKLKDTHKSDNAAVLIGTYREITEKQVRFLENMGFRFRKPSTHPRNALDLYRFKLDSDWELIDDAFINHLSGYDTIIISGGATANHVLKKSGFIYIENHESIMPLVSTGTIRGGTLDGIKVVLKGGLIGNESCYLDILKYVGVKYD